MKRELSKKYRLLQKIRILSQWVFFLLFLYLFAVTHYTGQDYIGQVEIYFHFDPLLAFVTYIASRLFFISFSLAVITLIITLLLGRVACGWVCPLGSLHQFFSRLFKMTKLLTPKRSQKGPLNWKYYLLFFILVSSLFTLDVVGFLDPLSFLYRSFGLSVFPAFSYGFSVIIGLLYDLHLSSLGSRLSQFFQNLTVNSTFEQGFFIGLLFLGIIFLNVGRERFWCRYLCPLGALLGLFSRWNIIKLSIDPQRCIECDLCNLHCQTEATPFPLKDWKSSECIYCFTCGAICPTKAISFPFKFSPEKISSVNLSRRKLILTSLLGLVVIPIFRLSPAAKRSSPRLIRPPGALPEDQFLRKCVKCGECMKVCPTNALQPALSEAGPEGIWTPKLVPQIGYCEYYCTFCTQVCPTGALRQLTMEEKASFKIGSAWVDKSRCIPFVVGRSCIVCEEHCPTSPKAIKLIKTETKLPDGTTQTPLAPVVDLDLCIGCGICETKCPVVDEPAIYITSIGETRSEKNQLLLTIIKEELNQ